MPKLYRTMLADERDPNKPAIGPSGKKLGVRVPPDAKTDVLPDEEDNVHPRSGGMSVVSHWTKLPYFLIPKRLRAVCPGARGSAKLQCWRFGEGDFSEGFITAQLCFRPDEGTSPTHGLVEPADIMPVVDFQNALAETQDYWTIDES